MQRTHAMMLSGALVALLLAATGLAAVQYRRGAFALVQPDRAAWPDRGLDVSHHQGAIDWQAVATEDVDFVWIKATEGGDWTDPAFETNRRGAEAAGIPWGAYHFVTLCRPLDEQVAHIAATVPRTGAELPLALDLEYTGNCSGRPEVKTFRRELRAMILELDKHFGRSPVLYTTSRFEADYLGDFEGVQVWRRSLTRAPEPGTLVWQYRDQARVAGIAGPVDMNVADLRRIRASRVDR